MIPASTAVDPGSPGGFSRTPFPGNMIPANRIDPVSRRVLDQLFPLPTGPGEVANLLASPTQRVDEDQYTVRIDHRFNAQNSIFGRYSQTNPERVLPLTFSQLPNFADIWDQPAKNVALSYSRIFSPRTVNELIVGYNRFVQNLLDYDYQRDVPRELGINRLDSRFGGNPAISIAGYGRTAGITNSPNNRYDNVYQFTDNFTHVHGNHSLGMGASFRHIANNRAGTQPNPRGIFNFTARYSTLPGVANTGNAMADFLLGYPTQTQGGIGHGFRYTRHNEFGAYFKDDWQVSSQSHPEPGIALRSVSEPGMRSSTRCFTSISIPARSLHLRNTNRRDSRGLPIKPIRSIWRPGSALLTAPSATTGRFCVEDMESSILSPRATAWFLSPATKRRVIPSTPTRSSRI